MNAPVTTPFYPLREHWLDIVNHTEVERELIPWDELRAETLAVRDELDARWAANACGTGLSSSTEPKVSALRVSIPFAGDAS